MTWDREPRTFILDVEEDVAETRTQAALYALRSLIYRTPVKTGRARSGWTVSAGQTIRTADRGEGQQAKALSDGLNAIAALKDKPYERVNIMNGIPYIGKLDAGSSKQAPSGFVDIVYNDIKIRFT